MAITIIYSIIFVANTHSNLDISSVKGTADGPLRLPPHYVEENYDISKLRIIAFPHGTFFFGSDSHQAKIPKSDTFDPSASWTPLQRELLDDADINIEEEKKRCASYNFGFPSNTTLPLKRRRLFYGALISGESAEVMKARLCSSRSAF